MTSVRPIVVRASTSGGRSHRAPSANGAGSARSTTITKSKYDALGVIPGRFLFYLVFWAILAVFVPVDIPVDYSNTELTPTKMPTTPYFPCWCHDYESKGRGFESRRAHQGKDPRKPYKTRRRGFSFVLAYLWKTPVENGKKLRYYRPTTDICGGVI